MHRFSQGQDIMTFDEKTTVGAVAACYITIAEFKGISV
jgi:hypothetical protein